MARITVEDCILKVPNRFNLVLTAAQRARDLSAGTPLTVERDNDKNPVVALREIADETIAPEDLRQSLIQSLQRHVEQDEPEDEDLDAIAVGAGLGLAAPGEDDESLVEQEIAEEVLAVGEDAVEAGAEIADAADEADDSAEEGGGAEDAADAEDEGEDEKD